MRSDIAWFMFCGILSSSTVSIAADQEKQPSIIKYTPPMRGAPLERVGGGTRSLGDDSPISLLAHRNTDSTIEQQPTLYWLVLEPQAGKLEFVIINSKTGTRLLARTLDDPVVAGIQGLNLRDLGVKLEKDGEYRWLVRLVSDTPQHDKDVKVSAFIRVVPSSSELEKSLAHADGIAKMHVYEDAGLWYDALNSISESIQSHPDDREYREQRAKLLKRSSLRDAANYELRVKWPQ